MAPNSAPGRGHEEQCSEIGRLPDDGSRGVHSIELGGESEPCETTVEAVLSAPGRALVIEIEPVSAPGMTDEIVDGTKAIKRTTERTVEERMQALPGSGGRGDLERPFGAYGNDELCVVFVGVRTTGEGHSDHSVAAFSSEEAEEVIGLQLELSVRPDHLGIAMSASRLQVPLAHHDRRRRPNLGGCAHVDVVPHLVLPSDLSLRPDRSRPAWPPVGFGNGPARPRSSGWNSGPQLERTRPPQSRPGLGGRRRGHQRLMPMFLPSVYRIGSSSVSTRN